jgi:hypothetical protein
MPNRHFRLLALPFLILLFICAGVPTEPEGEKFATAVYEAVKSNDSVSFHKLVITAEEFAAVADASTWSDVKKASVKKRITQHFLDSATAVSFREVRVDKQGNKVAWEKAVVDSISTTAALKEGMNEMRFQVYFSSGAVHYRLSGSKVLQTPAGWKMSNGIQLIRLE